LTGAGLAFLVGFIVAAFRQYRTPVIASARDVGDALDLPVLARINAVGDGKGANPQDSVLGMLSAIERLGARGPIHRLVVVGPSNDLERSKLVLALGCAIARNFDQPVALIDADLEHSSLTKLIGATDEPGLAECLAGDLRVDQTLLRLENGHTPQILNGMVPPSGMIRVMPAGVNRGGSLLRMRSNLHQVLGALSGRYVVVIDGPQVPGPVPVSSLLSLSDATIVVVTEGSTSIREARFTGDALRSATTNPVGAVVLKK
jgi:Mrp family chromosome partitioning ATPase